MAPKKQVVHKLPRIALAFFVVGLILGAAGFAMADGAVPWFRLGAAAWLSAYFLVLLDNFKRKLPVQTRGGVVSQSQGRVRYALPYLPFLIMGLVAAVVVATAE